MALAANALEACGFYHRLASECSDDQGQAFAVFAISWLLPNSSVFEGKRGIKEVYCGPSAAAELKQKVVRDLLFANECWSVGVLPSEIPLRA